MVVRRRKKKNILRAERTHGKGNTKNHRGAGSRGGVGKAGSHKHKYSKYYMDFGKSGVLKTKTKGKSITLTELEIIIPKLLARKKIIEKNGAYLINYKKTGIGKILGSGQLKSKIIIKNIKVTEKAIQKIEQAGGEIITTQKQTNQTKEKK